MTFRRLVTVTIIPVSIIMVIWATLGHVFFGLEAWIGLGLVFYIAPAVIGLMIIAKNIAPKYYDIQLKPAVSQTAATLYVVLYGLLFLFGIFIVDYSDSENSEVSLASLMFGRSFIDASWLIAYVLAGLIAAAIIVLYVHIYKTNRALKKTNAKNPQAIKT